MHFSKLDVQKDMIVRSVHTAHDHNDQLTSDSFHFTINISPRDIKLVKNCGKSSRTWNVGYGQRYTCSKQLKWNLYFYLSGESGSAKMALKFKYEI